MNFTLIATSALASLALGVQLTVQTANTDPAYFMAMDIVAKFGYGDSKFIDSLEFEEWWGPETNYKLGWEEYDTKFKEFDTDHD